MVFSKALIPLSVSYLIVVLTVSCFAAPWPEAAYPAQYGGVFPRAAYLPYPRPGLGLRSVSGRNESTKMLRPEPAGGHIRLLVGKRMPYYSAINVIDDQDDFLRKRAINDDPEPIEFLGRK
ncbi:uncharacterized protein LOC129582720 isoform X1 [Paramacrobiotus metropolitanus]|uniref:uncharacterized protein LOC129582720 isoform X1 n=1 Tax=Paramacrobiotus metropolitanus TaxID=2943436 RepID=UPI002445D607|nr:uncharacterized protein LOC129582720 isoform X1 [Paramacrobiotus metropolitanus]